MKSKKLLIAAVLAVSLAACSAASVLAQIADWARVASTTVQGFAPLLAISNPGLASVATGIGVLIGDVGTGATAAESAGPGQAGTQKVISEIQAVVPQIQKFETDLTSTGVTMSKNDQAYVAGGIGVVLIGLEGYEAELQAQSGGTATTAQLRDVKGECYGFETTKGHGPYHLWADCDPDAAVDATYDTASKTVVVAKKPPTVANFKRQINALARKYGHPEKQLPLSTRDHLVHVVTFGTR